MKRTLAPFRGNIKWETPSNSPSMRRTEGRRPKGKPTIKW